jgi:tripartite-type tricarboxylate transporter receptor subunit TctC
MKRQLIALVLAVTLAGVSNASAQGYPSRPVTIIAPLAPGGSTDVIGRIMADGMRASLGPSGSREAA